MSPIEVRIPACGEWARRITAVAELAKTGYDWEGPFLRPCQVVDLIPGTLCVTCSKVKHSYKKDATLWVLKSNANWQCIHSLHSTQWSHALRGDARRLLAMSREDRVIEAFETCIAANQEGLPELKKKLGEWNGSKEGRMALKEKLKVHAERIAENQIALDQFRENRPPAPPPNPLAGLSDADLLAELQRRSQPQT